MIIPASQTLDITDTPHSKDLPPNLSKDSLRQDYISCRICLQSSDISNIIHPCRCSGSVKYVHQQCLKTWILSQNRDLDQSKCQLCQTPFQMKYEIITKFSSKQICQQGIAHCIFAPLLLTVVGMLVLIIYLLILRYIDEDTSNKDKVYCMILIVSCGLAALILVFLVFHAVKDSCFVQKMEDWKILSQEFEEIIDETIQNDELVQVKENKDMITVPPLVLIRGRKVQRPEIDPVNLTPVSCEGRFVIYRPTGLVDSCNFTARQRYGRRVEGTRHRHSLSEIISIEKPM